MVADADRIFLYGFIMAVVLILVGMAHKQWRKAGPPENSYLGTQTRVDDVLGTIEKVAVRVVAEFPNEDETALARRVRDHLILAQMKNADLYESSILSIVRRLRGGMGTVQRWTD